MKEQLRKEYEEKERKLAEAAAEAGHSHWFCRSAVRSQSIGECH